MTRSRTVTIRWSLFRNLIFLIALLAGSILVTTIFTARRVVESASRARIERALDRTVADFDRFVQPVRVGLSLARDWTRNGLVDLRDPDAFNRAFVPMAERIPRISSVNAGYPDGSGLLLLRLADRWRNREVGSAESGGPLSYREWGSPAAPDREWRVDKPAEEERYDPRIRDWYVVAMNDAKRLEPDVPLPVGIYWSDPYTFFTSGEPGITASAHVIDEDGRRGILAFDLLLRDLSEFTRQLEVSPNGFALVATPDRRVVGLPRHPVLEDPQARAAALLQPIDQIGIQAAVDGVAARSRQGPDPPEVFSFDSEGETYWAGGRPYALGINREFRIVVAVPERDLLGPITQQRIYLASASLLALAVATGMALLLARRYSAPLRQLAANSQRIRELDLTETVRVHSRLREVDQLADEQERMRATLDSFARYVPIDLVRELLDRGEAARIGGDRRTLTILFTDIEGFTTISERLSLEALTSQMVEYFEALLDTIRAHGGEVIQLLGDGVMAFWGAPVPDDSHAAHAIEAVQACREKLAELDARWSEMGSPPLPTRFGLAAGPVVVGNVGSPSRLAYAAVGDAVNLASRIEGLNRFYGTRALASDAVRRAVAKPFEWRRVDTVRAKGKFEAIDLYEPLGNPGNVPAARLELRDGYEHALGLYRAREFQAALGRLDELGAAFPGDLSIERLRGLARDFTESPPGPDWDGVTDFYEK